MGELYEGCLREELRTTEGDAVEAADMGSVEGIIFGGYMNVQWLEDLSLLRQLPSYRFGDCQSVWRMPLLLFRIEILDTGCKYGLSWVIRQRGWIIRVAN